MNSNTRQLDQAIENALEGELEEAQNMAHRNSNFARTVPEAFVQRQRSSAQDDVVNRIHVSFQPDSTCASCWKRFKIFVFETEIVMSFNMVLATSLEVV